MAVAAAAKLWGSGRGLGRAGHLLLRRFGARGLARYVSPRYTGSFPQGSVGMLTGIEGCGVCAGSEGRAVTEWKRARNYSERTLGKNFLGRGEARQFHCGP